MSIRDIQNLSDFNDTIQSHDSSMSSSQSNLSHSNLSQSAHTSKSFQSPILDRNIWAQSNTDIGANDETFGYQDHSTPEEDVSSADDSYVPSNDGDDELDPEEVFDEKRYSSLKQKRSNYLTRKIKQYLTSQLSIWEANLKLSIESFVLIIISWSLEVAKTKLSRDEIDKELASKGYFSLGRFPKKDPVK